jgi:hypothetical protein
MQTVRPNTVAEPFHRSPSGARRVLLNEAREAASQIGSVDIAPLLGESGVTG